MEMQWEHKIKKAYRSIDESSVYSKKEALWAGIIGANIKRKGVSAFWRIAAIVLVLITFGGVFASISIVKKKEKQWSAIHNQNIALQKKNDDLLSVKPETITKIKEVEKEKIIYREVPVPLNNNLLQKSDINEINNTVLKLSKELEISQSNVKAARDSLKLLLSEYEQQVVKGQLPEMSQTKFKIKTERVKVQLQSPVIEPSPKMKLQIFKIQADDVKYDTNSTFLKK